MIEGIAIEPFRGDYEGLERMAHASWRDEYGAASFPNFYRPAFLRYLVDRIPEDRRDLLLGAYRKDDGEIVAFLANLPQRFHFGGKILSGVYSCLLVVRKEYLRRGLALDVIRTAVELNKKYGFDFSLLTLETGHRSTRMMEKLRADGHRIERVRKSGVMARVLDLDRVDASEGLKGYEKAAIRLLGAHRPPKAAPEVDLRDYRVSDLDACHTLLDRYKDSRAWRSAWDKKDLAIELDYPDVARTLVWEKDGRVQAMINFVRHDQLGRTRRALRLDQPRRFPRSLRSRADGLPPGLPPPHPRRRLHRHGRFRKARLAGRAVLSGPLHPLPEGRQPRLVDIQSGDLARRRPGRLRDPGLRGPSPEGGPSSGPIGPR